MSRCPWATGRELEAYHDAEWGRPVTDERGLFETLTLEAFQSGLSWLTILRKRDAFRRAFAGFDAAAVARFGARDVERLLGDASIVRNRAKIDATVANARAIAALRAADADFAAFVWSFAPEPRPAPRDLAAVPGESPESRALARALKAAGFRFVGATTAYALMQAAGLVNDHVEGCDVRDAVDREQEAARAADDGRCCDESALTRAEVVAIVTHASYSWR